MNYVIDVKQGGVRNGAIYCWLGVIMPHGPKSPKLTDRLTDADASDNHFPIEIDFIFTENELTHCVREISNMNTFAARIANHFKWYCTH